MFPDRNSQEAPRETTGGRVHVVSRAHWHTTGPFFADSGKGKATARSCCLPSSGYRAISAGIAVVSDIARPTCWSLQPLTTLRYGVSVAETGDAPEGCGLIRPDVWALRD